MRKTWMLILTLFAAACEKPVEIDIPYDGDRIVLNGFLVPDSVAYIRVTRSQPPGAAFFPELPEAKLTLKGGAAVIPLDWQVINGKGYFVTRAPLPAGVTYRIEAAAAGLDTVHAQDTMPRAPQIREPYVQAGGSRVKFVLRDLPGRDFYRFRLYEAEVPQPGEKAVPHKRLKYRFDPSYNNSFTDLITNSYQESALIADDRFEGKEITVVMQTEAVTQAGKVVLMEVESLSFAAWQYLKSLELQNANEGNLLVEQIRVYSNVDKGFGVFGGTAPSRLEVAVK
ncbi:DUF4249 domain-containing protein [Chitinophaga lutea]